MLSPRERILDAFQRHYGCPPQLVVRSPGRINLLGEHTDYNGGPVLPAAIDRAVWLAAALRYDRRCRLWACDYEQGLTIETMPPVPMPEPSWANYVLGVLTVLGWSGGIDIAFGGDLPIGAGVSSSAAVENATAVAVNALLQLGLTPEMLAFVSQKAEQDFVGVPCGIMDMFAGIMGRKDAFLWLDCRTLTWEPLPFQSAEWVFVLCHSGVERRLAASAYGVRRRECAEGLALLQRVAPELKALAEASPTLLEAVQDTLPPAIWRRCRYVVGEVGRVAAATEALRRQDMATLGALMVRTHEGLRDDFEVSCAELDFLAQQAWHHEACAGARLMGAGFGGCTLNLVRQDAAEDFCAQMEAAYRVAFGRHLLQWTVKPADGATYEWLK